MAIALVLLVSAGLLLRSVQRLFAIPPGFSASHLLTMQVQDYSRRPVPKLPRRSSTRLGRASTSAHCRPCAKSRGFRDAAFTSQLPLSGDFEGNSMQFES